MHVVLAGGGTAGHVEPALALADALRRADPGVGVTFLGSRRGLETRLVSARGYELALLPPVPLPRRVTPQLLTVPVRLASAVTAAARVLRRVRGDVLVGFGGYVALPAYLAARRLGVPVVVHEANARPGLANRIGARLAHTVAVATAGCPLPRAQVVGIPLRRAVATLDRPARRAEARATFGLALDRPTLLVFGGSQGARRLNEAVTGAVADLVAGGAQVLHLTGAASTALPPPAPASAGYVRLAYTDRMELAYAAADLALCRAGAMTCAELAAVGLPAAYVPLPHGNGEQRWNAAPVVAAGGGLLVADAACTADWVRTTLLPLLGEPDRLAAMGAAAARLGRRDADEALAGLVRAAGGPGQ